MQSDAFTVFSEESVSPLPACLTLSLSHVTKSNFLSLTVVMELSRFILIYLHLPAGSTWRAETQKTNFNPPPSAPSLSVSLLYLNVSRPPGLKDILHMVSSQWDQLQRQIRRQHSWMLRALRCIQARLLYTSQSFEPFLASGDAPANWQPPCPADGLKVRNTVFICFLFVFHSALHILPFPPDDLCYPSLS